MITAAFTLFQIACLPQLLLQCLAFAKSRKKSSLNHYEETSLTQRRLCRKIIKKESKSVVVVFMIIRMVNISDFARGNWIRSSSRSSNTSCHQFATNATLHCVPWRESRRGSP